MVCVWIFSLITMLLTVNAVSGAAWCCCWLCRKITESFIRNNRVKKISSEPDAVIQRATYGSRAIGSRPLHWPFLLILQCDLEFDTLLELTTKFKIFDFAVCEENECVTTLRFDEKGSACSLISDQIMLEVVC